MLGILERRGNTQAQSDSKTPALNTLNLFITRIMGTQGNAYSDRSLARALVLGAVVCCGAVASGRAESWIFRPSTFSHDAATGQRVAQFQPEAPAYYRSDPTYQESGYRHIRSALRGADGSYDYQHIVQTWGLGQLIRPYGEWEYPYRAGATPYGPWGNPSGPWTLPFDSWINPYGLGKLPTPPWSPWFPGGVVPPMMPPSTGPAPGGPVGPPSGPGPWLPPGGAPGP